MRSGKATAVGAGANADHAGAPSPLTNAGLSRQNSAARQQRPASQLFSSVAVVVLRWITKKATR